MSEQSFKAFRIHERKDGVEAGFETMTTAGLTPGDVLIQAAFSSINYKDALAATGAGKILRRSPLNGGIDVAGRVVESDDARYSAGDAVLVTGCGLGESLDGGYAQFVRAPGDCVIAIPEGLDERSAMALGTAGFTAGLAILRMEENGQRPENGAVVVTGATGGVGSLAVNMLSGCGYEVVAVTGKRDADAYLRELGAARMLDRRELDLGRRPLEKALWAGAVDNVGGEVLAWLTRTMDYGGNIASIGLAGSHELHTTVMPFILRAVNLLGINSVDTPRELRLAVWQRLAADLKPAALERIASRTVAFEELPEVFPAFLEGRVTGRVVVAIPRG